MPCSRAGLKSLSLILSKGGAWNGRELAVSNGLLDDVSEPLAADLLLLLHEAIIPIIVANGNINSVFIKNLKAEITNFLYIALY